MNAKYLDLLLHKYDSEEKVVTEIINLEAILNLPKNILSVIYMGNISFSACAKKWLRECKKENQRLVSRCFI